MSGLLDFFTKEAGQKRRAWLDEKDAELTGLLSYFAGPHASDAAGKAGGLLATMSDAADFQDYTDASRATMRDPNLGNLAALATAGTALMIPGVSARMAEGAVDFGQDVARFGREEDGAIRAFHGSPHDFDKFSMDKIGTGEGAQAYGHGLYFAESEGVAKSYRDALGGRAADRSEDTGSIGGRAFSELSNDERHALRMVRDWGSPEKAAEVAERQGLHERAAVARKMATGELPFTLNTGHMYEVNINAYPADFLDWDAPLSEQSKSVRSRLGLERDDASLIARKEALERRRDELNRAALNGVNVNLPENWGALWETTPEIDQLNSEIGVLANELAKSPEGVLSHVKSNIDDYQGEWANKMLASHLGGKEGAAHALRDAGIPGIKYRDAMSRDGAGEGTRNYVVFDDNLIDIVRKYGWAGLGLLGAFSPQQESDTLQ